MGLQVRREQGQSFFADDDQFIVREIINNSYIVVSHNHQRIDLRCGVEVLFGLRSGQRISLTLLPKSTRTVANIRIDAPNTVQLTREELLDRPYVLCGNYKLTIATKRFLCNHFGLSDCTAISDFLDSGTMVPGLDNTSPELQLGSHTFVFDKDNIASVKGEIPHE